MINNKALKVFISIFLIEIFIAVYVHDGFIRPFFGDFLAVIGVYYFIRTFFKISNLNTVTISLAIAYLLEVLQYFNFLDTLPFQVPIIFYIVLGSSFSWIDLGVYSLGGALVFTINYNFLKNGNIR